MNNLETLLADIERETVSSAFLTGREKLSAPVLEAMRRVPRDRFVPEKWIDRAFDNGPLPIGSGQTISQPFIVALMTDLLNIQKPSVVLEIGTGSGYQTAVLSLMANRVYTVELFRSLSLEAEARFKALNYGNIHTRIGNGYDGWPEFAPYDGVIVTAAAPRIPDALIGQLKPGGRLVIPVGLPFSCQELILLTKDHDGRLHKQKILDVAFVPLVDSQSPF